MKIFNSLGSNYDLRYLIETFFAIFKKSKQEELKRTLENKYNGKVFFFYKGREAIEAALKISSIPEGYFVAVNGLTCLVVDMAILNAGLKGQYLDIDNSLNFSSKELLENLKINDKIKVVIIQNTLGFPSDALNIHKISRKHNIILIEDLAHSVGTKYADGIEAGLVGDFVTLSFSQDKIIDSVSGGALIVRNKKYLNKVNDLNKTNIPVGWLIKDIFYPKFTYLIRKLYIIGLGKYFHWCLKKLNLLSNPLIINQKGLHNLPKWYINLALFYFIKLDDDLEHRKLISNIYANNLNKKVTSIQSQLIEQASNIRFPIFVKNRDKLIKYLKQNGIFVSDIWYDNPVAPHKYQNFSDYRKGSCPNSESISKILLNLPTHKSINPAQALRITQLINKWINIQ